MGWKDREWARFDEPVSDPFDQPSFARRRSRTVRWFAIALLGLFLLIAVASLAQL